MRDNQYSVRVHQGTAQSTTPKEVRTTAEMGIMHLRMVQVNGDEGMAIPMVGVGVTAFGGLEEDDRREGGVFPVETRDITHETVPLETDDPDRRCK